MKDDLRQINKEEDRLQRELLQIHKKNLTKHNEVISKNNIDTSIQNTEQLLRKLVNAPAADHKQQSSNNLPPKSRPSQPGKEDDPLEEQMIEESLENLDHLLEGLKKGTKEQEIARLG